MNNDNVHEFSPLLLAAATRLADTFKPPPVPDPELTLWDEVVRMRLSTMTFAGPGVPAELTKVDDAIDAANRVVLARRKFAAER
jgi:hypothetical protein